MLRRSHKIYRSYSKTPTQQRWDHSLNQISQFKHEDLNIAVEFDVQADLSDGCLLICPSEHEHDFIIVRKVNVFETTACVLILKSAENCISVISHYAHSKSTRAPVGLCKLIQEKLTKWQSQNPLMSKAQV